MLCLFTATIFWFFNALNKNYSANINFPITFEFDENYIPVKPLPRHIRLNVTGLGWQLLRKSTGLKVPPLSILLESPAEVKKIVASSLPPMFAPQLEGLQINFVLTDTIFVQIEKKVSRNVHITLASPEGNLNRNFGISSEIKIQPEVVLLEGPESLLREFSDTLRLTLPTRNLDQPFNEDVEVKLESDLIKRNPPVVNVSFSIARLIQVTDTASLQIINPPKGVKTTVRIKEVSYTISIPETKADLISSDSVKAVLDLSGFEKGKHTLVPTLKGLPGFSKLLRVDTVDVSF